MSSDEESVMKSREADDEDEEMFASFVMSKKKARMLVDSDDEETTDVKNDVDDVADDGDVAGSESDSGSENLNTKPKKIGKINRSGPDFRFNIILSTFRYINFKKEDPGNPYLNGRLSTIGLLVLPS